MREGEKPIKLTRALGKRSPGYWKTGDGHFYLVRRPGPRTHWAIMSVQLSSWNWMERSGMRDARFRTRAEALTRLQDALRLEPLEQRTEQDFFPF